MVCRISVAHRTIPLTGCELNNRAQPTTSDSCVIPLLRRHTRINADKGTGSTTIASPINILLLSLLLLLIYFRLRPAAPRSIPKAPPAIVFRTFTPPELKPFNGENNSPVYLAVRGQVFDVTSGRNFYGPGGPYENFAGRDATRGLACGSFDEDMLTKDLQGPLDDLKGLGADEMQSLQDWEDRFSEKYLVVGKLVSVGDKMASEGKT